MPFPITAVGTTIGSLGAAALQRGWALKDWNRINEYNLPKNQVKRLREAGLPLASMFSGSGGSTSTDVRSSNVDPSLGTAQGMQAYQTNRMMRKQLELMDQDLRTKKAQADVAEAERNWKLAETPDIMFGRQATAPPSQNLAQTLEIEKWTSDAQRITAMAEERLRNVEMRVKELLETEGTLTEQERQKVKSMIAEISLKDVVRGDHELELKLKKQLYDHLIKAGGDFGGVIYQFLRKFILR